MSISYTQARLALRRIVSSRYASSAPQQNGAGRKPMIHFDAKTRHHDSKPGQPHPMAPKGIDFKAFGKGKPASSQSKPPSSSASSTSSSTSTSQPQQKKPAPSSSSKGLPPADYEEFYDMPPRYWQRPLLEESEIDAIMTGGATNLR